MRNIQNMLAYEISKKPFLRDIAERIDDMSLEEIEGIKFPLPWIRIEFIKMKKSHLHDIKLEKMRKEMGETSSGRFIQTEVTDPAGWLILWSDSDTFLKTDRGEISVMEGRYLFMPLTGGVFNDNIFSKFVDPKIMQYGQPKGQSTLTGYKKLQIDVRNGTCPLNAPVIDMTGSSTSTAGPSNRLAAMGVRFS